MAKKPPMIPAKHAHQKACRKADMPITTLVGSGRGMPADSNIVWNVGITKIKRMTIAIPATEKITDG